MSQIRGLACSTGHALLVISISHTHQHITNSISLLNIILVWTSRIRGLACSTGDLHVTNSSAYHERKQPSTYHELNVLSTCHELNVLSEYHALNMWSNVANTYHKLIYIPRTQYAVSISHPSMGWLRLVGSIKWQVSFAKEPYKRDAILQKRPIILSILLTVATPYHALNVLSKYREYEVRYRVAKTHRMP